MGTFLFSYPIDEFNVLNYNLAMKKMRKIQRKRR